MSHYSLIPNESHVASLFPFESHFNPPPPPFLFLNFSLALSHSSLSQFLSSSLSPDSLSISPENPLLQISIIILRKSTFHQEQD
jgi:hypothetical protein